MDDIIFKMMNNIGTQKAKLVCWIYIFFAFYTYSIKSSLQCDYFCLYDYETHSMSRLMSTVTLIRLKYNLWKIYI